MLYYCSFSCPVGERSCRLDLNNARGITREFFRNTAHQTCNCAYKNNQWAGKGFETSPSVERSLPKVVLYSLSAIRSWESLVIWPRQKRRARAFFFSFFFFSPAIAACFHLQKPKGKSLWDIRPLDTEKEAESERDEHKMAFDTLHLFLYRLLCAQYGSHTWRILNPILGAQRHLFKPALRLRPVSTLQTAAFQKNWDSYRSSGS